MSLSANHEACINEPEPRPAGWLRRLVVVLLGALVGTITIVALSTSFVQGSWWYPHLSDQAISEARRARLGAVRDELADSGLAPRVIAYLDAALAPNVAPTTMRDHLIEARELLIAAGDARVAPALREIAVAISLIRSWGFDPTVTPYPLPNLAPSG